MDHQRIKSNRSEDSFLNLFNFSNSLNRMFRCPDSSEARHHDRLLAAPKSQIGTFSFEKQYLASSSNTRSARRLECPPNIFISDFEDKPPVACQPTEPLPVKKSSALAKRPPCLKQEYIERGQRPRDSRQEEGCQAGTGIFIKESLCPEFASDSEEQSRQPLRLGREEALGEAPSLEMGCGEAQDESGGRVVNLKGILDYHIDEVRLLAHRNKKSYVCKYCAEVFSSGCALGGHISKIHRGVNREYGRKIKLREEKKTERERNAFLRKMEV
jgi:hypothetical protein